VNLIQPFLAQNGYMSSQMELVVVKVGFVSEEDLGCASQEFEHADNKSF
jgi:hypothetical protein